MQPIMPKVIVGGDREDQIMAQTGWIVGFRKHERSPYQIVWCFGFLPGSPQAQAYGVSVDEQIWIIADRTGYVEATFIGLKKDLPWVFQYVLERYSSEKTSKK